MSQLAELSELLWRERQALDVLLFKLEQERLVLDAGRLEWLARAGHEVELAAEELRLAGLARAVGAEAVVEELRLAPTATLAEIAAAAPTPWGEMFAAHREAMLRLSARIDELAEANRRAVEAARDAAVREARTATGELIW